MRNDRFCVQPRKGRKLGEYGTRVQVTDMSHNLKSESLTVHNATPQEVMERIRFFFQGVEYAEKHGCEMELTYRGGHDGEAVADSSGDAKVKKIIIEYVRNHPGCAYRDIMNSIDLRPKRNKGIELSKFISALVKSGELLEFRTNNYDKKRFSVSGGNYGEDKEKIQ